MDPDLIRNLVALLVILVIVAAGARYFLPIIRQHFAGSAGGWSRLAPAYATTRQRPAQWRSRQSLVVGQVLYRNCVTVGFDEAGLYLELGFPMSLLGRGPLFIPWSEVRQIDEGRLFWRKAALLSLGEPPVRTITLPMPLFEAMRPAMGKIKSGARAGATMEPMP